MKFKDVKKMPKDEMDKARTMVQNAIVHAVKSSGSKGAAPRLAFIKEGPYAVPDGRCSSGTLVIRSARIERGGGDRGPRHGTPSVENRAFVHDKPTEERMQQGPLTILPKQT